MLFGTLEPGGIINLVTKKPLSEPFYSAELQVGSFGFFRPTIDLSGPLNASETWLYRLNAAYETEGGFRDFDQNVDRVFIAPVLTSQISDRTDLTLEFQYLNDRRPFDRGIVAVDTGIADIPFDRILGELDDAAFSEQLTAGYQLEHRFSESWKLRNDFQFQANNSSEVLADPRSLDEATSELTRAWFDDQRTNRSYALQTNLVGEFTTGSVNHELLFGADLRRQDTNINNRFDFSSTPSINIFDPVYGVALRPERDELPIGIRVDGRIDTLGIYLQDQIALLDNLKLLVGGRFDLVDQESRFRSSSGADTRDQQQDNAFTPRIGLVYQPIEPVSLYTSFSQSFAPNSGTTIEEDLLRPERGTQYEVGIKSEFLDGRLFATLAAY